MKRQIGLLLVIAMMVFFSVPAFAKDSVAKNNNKTANGLTLSVSSFDSEFGQSDSKSDALSKQKKNAYIALSGIQISGDNIQFNATINYNNKDVELNANGKLYNSFRKKGGVNSIVGDIQDDNSSLNVLLFEVYNDNSKNKDTSVNSAIVDSKYINTPHVNVYLTDSEDNILLFEIPIPEELKNISVINHDDIEATKDYAWFLNVLQPSAIETTVATPEAIEAAGLDVSTIRPLGVDYLSDWTDSIYTYTETYGGHTYYWRTLAWGSWSAINFTGQGTFINSFKIAESVTMDNTVIYPTNLFKYKNVSLATAVGAKSTIIQTSISGTLEGKPSGSKLAMLVGEKIWSTILPVAPSLSDIASWISAAKSAVVSKDVYLGSTNVINHSTPLVVESVNSGSNYLWKCTDCAGTDSGHYITMHNLVQYSSTDAIRTSATANGNMTITWDLYLVGGTTTKQASGSKTITFQYTASPSKSNT